MSVLIVLMHSIVVEIFPSGTNWRTDQQSLIDIFRATLPSVAKNKLKISWVLENLWYLLYVAFLILK